MRSASWIGSWNGATMQAVPIRIRSVWAAMAAATSGRSARRAVRREVVFGQPDLVVAEFLGPPRLFEHVGENLLMGQVIGLVAEDEHAEPHADTSVRNIVAVTATILHD